ncbi:N-acetylmannosamine-6-phosphate 2-epimerase [Halobacillus litoralis]|uniref:N-acetylmannosamine-6-phosphate 2-epimerase n=1 Tax=Halobacillus litoralis TaxID=45668 RepID=UPI001CD36709|nr:N-acetylmannosamine-6-phosphate 2-epimerase [Halobacillus litoralis]MCA0970582.1 N-acetylmannosamine-6-phosphate 2-epimerase [Halobacillus litoralis]
MEKDQFFEVTEGRLIVSCQALEEEPLHGDDTMAKLAVAAEMGGASAIRANGEKDIKAIRQVTGLPIIGLVKRDYDDSDIYITPTRQEVEELIHAGANVIALDATNRPRPNNERLLDLIQIIQKAGVAVMADISTLEEGLHASSLGVDCVGTTLSGYTPYSPQHTGPDFNLVQSLAEHLQVPVLAEGRYWSPEEAVHALELGAHSVVVGSAITRPQVITKRFTEQLKKAGGVHDTKVVGRQFIKRHS